MTRHLKLKPAQECRWDAVALGEVMLRFDPGEGRIQSARSFDVWEGGGEYNVVRGLRKTFGLTTSIATALPRNALGRLCEDLILQGGVDTSNIIWRDADGIGRDTRLGLNFTERGFGVRGALGVSDRANSSASQLQPDEIDWDDLFGNQGVRWLHTGGIFAALSETSAQTTLAAVRAARRHGTIVSYDLNYRESLWASHPDANAARNANLEIATCVDVMIGDEYAYASCLGVETPEQRRDPCDPQPFLAMVERIAPRLPSVQIFAATLRDPLSASMNRWGGVVWSKGEMDFQPPEHVAILDRVGGGDAFVAGLVWGLMTERAMSDCLSLGLAHGAFAMTTPGDNAVVDLSEILDREVGKGAPARR